MAKTKYTCTACPAVGDKPEIIEHCTSATASSGVAHAVTELADQPAPVTEAHEATARRAEVREALAAQLDMPIEDIVDALRGP